MLWAAVRQILSLVESGFSVAFNAVRRGAPIRSDIAYEPVATCIKAVVTRCECQSFTPLEWWQGFLRIERINGFHDGRGPFNGSHLGEATAGVKVHPAEAAQSVLQLRDETLRVCSKLILFVKNLTIESGL